MRITEIFFSIQGESSFAGRPCVFVRLTGCPLRCTWCDTAYAFHGGTERSLESILAEVVRYECRLVEITGGEPLAQSDVHGLITALSDRGYTVLIETRGGSPSGCSPPACPSASSCNCTSSSGIPRCGGCEGAQPSL